MFLNKMLKNSVGQIITLPGQLYLVKHLLNRKQNKTEGEDDRAVKKLSLGPDVRWSRDEENVRKPRRKQGMKVVRTGLKTSSQFWDCPKVPALSLGSRNLWFNISEPT